ncbi:DNA-processing protein DprA [Bifidobacterium sp. AGR2158]|uniref:DNA-processing protein DprA n=2 Tax=Bifidobacterium TaxID=1678 RepID=UPI0004140593|nr:DNA-processing protein DprA [Bifidobacterium sp. AGR2158]
MSDAMLKMAGEADDALARCLLTLCIDDADIMMAALLKGADDARAVLTSLVMSMQDMPQPGRDEGMRILERDLALGIARWGCTLRPRTRERFVQAVERWHARLASLPSANPDSLRAWLTADGAYTLLTPGDEAWPGGFSDLDVRSDYAPPVCLWVRGDAGALTACAEPLAVVGSRGMNDYGREVTSAVAEEACLAGHTVVSGGAMGVDAAAHWAAVRAAGSSCAGRCGRTVAVFAGGLGHIGPSCNERLFAAILEAGGAFISELCPDTPPLAHRFLLRNRLIAAMASSVAVTQARLRSGALNTANWANELNRRLYAVPGDVTNPSNAGCNALIRDHRAILLADARAVDEYCHPRHAPTARATPPEP